MTNHSLSWVGPISLGAALMYLFDPNNGRRRRALLRDQSAHLARRTRETSEALASDLQNRVSGLRARLDRTAQEEFVDDATLEARVRSKLGRVSTHPGAIAVQSINGIVTLIGPVLTVEHRKVVRAVESVRGINEVVDQLSVHDEPGSVPGLQGEGSRPQNALLSSNWSPATRLAAVGSGAALIAYGIQQRSLTGGLAASIGAGLLSRGLVGLDLPSRVTEALGRSAHRKTGFDIGAGEQGMLGTSAPAPEGGYV